MILRILLAGILGAVAFFIWGFVAHMVLQLGDGKMKQIPEESVVLGTLREKVTEPGIYGFPYMDMSHTPTEEETKAYNSKWRQGPSGLLIYSPRNERDYFVNEQLILQFVVYLMLSLLSAMLLAQAAATLPSFIMRLFFILLIGLIAGIAVPLPWWIWYGYPSDYIEAVITEQVFGFVLAGLIIAAIVRAKAPAAPAPAPAAVK